MFGTTAIVAVTSRTVRAHYDGHSGCRFVAPKRDSQHSAPSRSTSLDGLDEESPDAVVCPDLMDTDMAHLFPPLAEDTTSWNVLIVICAVWPSLRTSRSSGGRQAALGSECFVLIASETAPQRAERRSSPHSPVARVVMCSKDSIDYVYTFRRLNRLSTLR